MPTVHWLCSVPIWWQFTDKKNGFQGIMGRTFSWTKKKLKRRNSTLKVYNKPLLISCSTLKESNLLYFITGINYGRQWKFRNGPYTQFDEQKLYRDIIITLLPGWVEVDSKRNPVGESNAIFSNAPFIFYGWKIKPQNISTSYKMTDIAPTVSYLMNLPMPNASIGEPINELTK